MQRLSKRLKPMNQHTYKATPTTTNEYKTKLSFIIFVTCTKKGSWDEAVEAGKVAGQELTYVGIYGDTIKYYLNYLLLLYRSSATTSRNHNTKMRRSLKDRAVITTSGKPTS